MILWLWLQLIRFEWLQAEMEFLRHTSESDLVGMVQVHGSNLSREMTLLMSCWHANRVLLVFSLTFVVFFSLCLVRRWMWQSKRFCWRLCWQPAPDYACQKLSRCTDRFLRASKQCLEMIARNWFLNHSKQSLLFEGGGSFHNAFRSQFTTRPYFLNSQRDGSIRNAKG